MDDYDEQPPPRVVYPVEQSDREADLAFKFLAGGCLAGVALGVLGTLSFLYFFGAR